MTTTKQEQAEAKDRLVSAALRYAAAERGGLDHANSAAELELADDILTDAANSYVTLLGTAIEGE